MLDANVVLKLKERYPQLHPALFHRSVERAKSVGHLFDILETIPKEFPLIWSDTNGCWIECNDIYQSQEFFEALKK